MKSFGVLAMFSGLLFLIFAGLAYSELRAAGTAEVLPSTDELPLTKLVGPELFNPKHAATRPSDLAASAFRRIFIIGGVGIGSFALGIFLFMASQKCNNVTADAQID